MSTTPHALYPHLLAPLTVRNLRLRNRMIMGAMPVSYTHLDVYKRQNSNCVKNLNPSMERPNMFKVEELGQVVCVTMQRAPVNAISNEFVAGFMQVLDGLAARKDLAVFHLRSDQKAFCAGADLAQVQSRFSMEKGAELSLIHI